MKRIFALLVALMLLALPALAETSGWLDYTEGALGDGSPVYSFPELTLTLPADWQGKVMALPGNRGSSYPTMFFRKDWMDKLNLEEPKSFADVIKIAMNRVDRRLRAEIPAARLILQVHDELLVEAPEADIPAVKALLDEEMPAALPLAVKLEADVHDGKRWDECK